MMKKIFTGLILAIGMLWVMTFSTSAGVLDSGTTHYLYDDIDDMTLKTGHTYVMCKFKNYGVLPVVVGKLTIEPGAIIEAGGTLPEDIGKILVGNDKFQDYLVSYFQWFVSPTGSIEAEGTKEQPIRFKRWESDPCTYAAGLYCGSKGTMDTPLGDGALSLKYCIFNDISIDIQLGSYSKDNADKNALSAKNCTFTNSGQHGDNVLLSIAASLGNEVAGYRSAVIENCKFLYKGVWAGSYRPIINMYFSNAFTTYENMNVNIKNCLINEISETPIAQGIRYGVYGYLNESNLNASDRITIENVTINGCRRGLYFDEAIVGSGMPTYKNCIIANCDKIIGNENSESVENGSLKSVVYSCLFGYTDCEQSDYGVGNIFVAPLFVDASAGDFHLKSTGGRWDETAGTWKSDNISSPCIDTGSPDSDYSLEPDSNGGRINMGYYGNTVWASKMPGSTPVTPGDNNEDETPGNNNENETPGDNNTNKTPDKDIPDKNEKIAVNA